MERQKKVLFIVNPVSGKGRKDIVLNAIQNLLLNSQLDITVEQSAYRGHAIELAKNAAKAKIDLVVAVGGDGTINEVASGLIHSESVLAIIPVGSGNGLARHLKIPLNIDDALDLIANPHKIISIDYGLINNQPFFCTCGVGFDAHIGHKFANAGTRGFSTYVRTAINSFFSYRSKKYRLRFDDREIKTRAFLITCANASQYGNNAYIAPNADLQDGLMDISLVTPFPRHYAIGLGLKLFGKRIDKFKYIELMRTQKVSIRRKNIGEVHYDGEPAIMGKKIKVKIIAAGLKVLVS